MTKYKFMGAMDRCNKCGSYENLTKHHWKKPGAVNGPTHLRTGAVILMCRKCQDNIHKMKPKKKPGLSLLLQWAAEFQHGDQKL